MNQHPESTERVYRVDKFTVPDSARNEFIQKVKDTHKLLRTLPGFLQDFVLEQVSDLAEFNIVTIVEWEDMGSVKQAKERVHTMHKETGFDPNEFIVRLGIRADRGNYKSAEF